MAENNDESRYWAAYQTPEGYWYYFNNQTGGKCLHFQPHCSDASTSASLDIIRTSLPNSRTAYCSILYAILESRWDPPEGFSSSGQQQNQYASR